MERVIKTVLIIIKMRHDLTYNLRSWRIISSASFITSLVVVSFVLREYVKTLLMDILLSILLTGHRC